MREEVEAFFNEHYESLLTFATWWGKDPHDADDALAQVMVEIGQIWTTIRNPVAVARTRITWAIFNLRRDRGDGRYIAVPPDRVPDQAQDCLALDRLENEETVEGLLSQLPPTQREVMKLYIEGLSMYEIAAELRKSESTIRQNLHHARSRLRPLVAEYDRRKPSTSGEQTREDNR